MCKVSDNLTCPGTEKGQPVAGLRQKNIESNSVIYSENGPYGSAKPFRSFLGLHITVLSDTFL